MNSRHPYTCDNSYSFPRDLFLILLFFFFFFSSYKSYQDTIVNNFLILIASLFRIEYFVSFFPVNFEIVEKLVLFSPFNLGSSLKFLSVYIAEL